MRKIILTGFFLLLITSTVYGLAFAPKISLDEKRRPAGIPEFSAWRLLNSQYYFQLAKYLDDRYPFRAPLIITKSHIDYDIFNTSPSTQVHLGKDGWFYLTWYLKEDFTNNCKRKKEARELARKLNAFEKALTSADKKFFFIVAPNKSTIYPEHLGFDLPSDRGCGSFYDLFIEALGEYPVHGFIRLDKLLLDAKAEYPLYYKQDSHWNHRGAFIAAGAILQRLSTAENRYSMPQIEFMGIKLTKDLTKMIAMNLAEISDYAINIHTYGTVSKQNLKPLLSGKSHLRITTRTPAETTLLPRTLIYRDSFMGPPLQMISSLFTEIDVLWTRRIPVAPKRDFPIIRDSKIVIIEIVEKRLGDLDLREKALIRAINGWQRNQSRKNL